MKNETFDSKATHMPPRRRKGWTRWRRRGVLCYNNVLISGLITITLVISAHKNTEFRRYEGDFINASH